LQTTIGINKSVVTRKINSALTIRLMVDPEYMWTLGSSDTSRRRVFCNMEVVSSSLPLQQYEIGEDSTYHLELGGELCEPILYPVFQPSSGIIDNGR
jgi:hypothetical protein